MIILNLNLWKLNNVDYRIATRSAMSLTASEPKRGMTKKWFNSNSILNSNLKLTAPSSGYVDNRLVREDDCKKNTYTVNFQNVPMDIVNNLILIDKNYSTLTLNGVSMGLFEQSEVNSNTPDSNSRVKIIFHAFASTNGTGTNFTGASVSMDNSTRLWLYKFGYSSDTCTRLGTSYYFGVTDETYNNYPG